MAQPSPHASGQLHSQGHDAPIDGSPTAQVSFPRDPQEFQSDPRVSYSKVENKWILEEPNGSEWEYDETAQRWIPSLDEALLEQQRRAYAVQGVDEAEPAQPSNKRKQGDDGKAPAKKQKPSKEKPERKNTAVYVTSLPLNVDADEVNRVFSRCGVISEEIDSGNPRIKLYTDDSGKFKGDALVVYFRPESVALAIQMLDDSDFRFGEAGPAGKMRVKEADWSYKKTKENQEEGKNGGAAAAAAGDGDGNKPAQRKGGFSQEQKKVIRKTEKMKAKLADWSDDEDPQALEQKSSRFDNVVILKRMFTLAELEEDAAAILDIKEDIREECSRLGEVTNVVLFDKEQGGVVTVRFTDGLAARACVKLMDGRNFDGRKVEAYISDGTERFKKTREKSAAADPTNDDDSDEEGKRMDEFGNWLEAEKGKNKPLVKT